MALKPLPPLDLDHVLVGVPWEELRGARLFITGGTGFFGIWLLESLSHANAHLNLDVRAVVLSRDPDKFQQAAPHLAADATFSWVRGDVRDFEFPPGAFSHVIHAATEASAKLNAQAPLEMFDVCAQGTRRTLDFAVQSSAKRFLLISSGAVYGAQPPEIPHLSEEFTGAPNPQNLASAYGEGKRVAEWLSVVYAQKFGLDVVTARAWAFIGPHLPLDAHFAAGNFLRDALCGGPIRVGGDGTPFRSYLYAADLAIWLWTLLLRGKNGRAYNVGSDEAVSIAELAQRTARLAGGVQVEMAQKAQVGAVPTRYVPSIERVRQELNLNLSIGLDEAIGRTLLWLRS